MVSHLYHEYARDTDVTKADVRGAISQLTDDDVSVSSPISEGGEEVAVMVRDEGDSHTVVLRVEGHGGDWTKTSEEALSSAVQSVEGVGNLVDSDGGYDG